MRIYVIMLAGGRGTRMKASSNKVLLSLCGKTVIRRSVEAFIPFADEMVIVSRPEEQTAIQNDIRLLAPFAVHYAPGGMTRQDSVLNGLNVISPAPDDLILIHDAARCLVDKELIMRVIRSAEEYGSGIPGVPVTSTCKICDNSCFVVNTPDRSSLYEIQTPQGFKAEKIISAARKASEDHYLCTDDAGLLEHYHIPVRVVTGSSANFKMTEPGDLSRARSLLKGDESVMRIGMGYDVHRLIPGRKLILCGIEIPYDFGLLGHSDADVAIHALMDAMLGACALGDIGSHFPDTNERYHGISSLLLLKETSAILSDAGWEVNNADVTIVAQKPKLLSFIPLMTASIASALGLPDNRVSVKATTTEKLGFEGRMEGISAYAVCSVTEKER